LTSAMAADPPYSARPTAVDINFMLLGFIIKAPVIRSFVTDSSADNAWRSVLFWHNELVAY
jgi:hypothetical protein